MKTILSVALLKNLPHLLVFVFFSYSISYSQGIPTGQVIDTVNCTFAPSQSYALYIPQTYNPEKDWPVVFLFEPLARGRLPIDLYSEVANALGYILVCSNNSKNGLVSKSVEAYELIKKDIERRLTIDTTRLYTSGFSGGARLAQYLANSQEDIAGTITIGGPTIDTTPAPQSGYVYFGIVGNRDMNYIEHKNFQQELNDQGLKNILLTYQGAHHWAPPPLFKIALEWLQIQHSIAAKKITEHQLSSYLNQLVKKINSLPGLSQIDQYNYLHALDYSLQPLTHPILADGLAALKDDAIDKALVKEKKQFQKETREYVEIATALQQIKVSAYQTDMPLDSSAYPMRWWEQKIFVLKKRSEKTDEKGEAAARTLDVIRGQVFGVNLKASSADNLQYQIYLKRIQLMLYPKSVQLLWDLTLLQAKNNEQREALKTLQKAKKIDSNKVASIIEISAEKINNYPFLTD